MERKLAAIFAADVAGYTRLMGVDEEGTLHALRAHREVVDGLIAAHRGRVFHTAGDSVIAEFPSAVEATLCAVEVQQELARRNEPVPQDRRIEFRIGINIGDVIVDGGNLFGDGVNVADRVQKLAEPGGACVSRNVHDQLRNKVGFTFEPMGAHQVKNVATPVSIYRVVVDGRARRSRFFAWFAMARRHRRLAAVMAVMLVVAGAGLGYWQTRGFAPARTGGFPTLAVLPFDNLSGEGALDSYSDGVTDDIFTTLSRFPDITVVPRNSSSAFKGGSVDPVEAGRQLGADYVLQGSVQKKGNALRIGAQLIDARTNLGVWSDGYEGSDPASLQDEAVVKIGAALPGDRGEIRKHEYTRIKDIPTADLDAYGYYLRGHELIFRARDIEEHDRGGAVWLQGMKAFPGSALLRIEAAWYYFMRPWDFDTDKPYADYRRAGSLARDALAGPNLSRMEQWKGGKLMAYIAWFDGDFVRAVADAEAAVALAPYDADTLSFLARVQIAAGNTNRAVEWIRESERRDPDLWRNTRLLAWIYYLNGDYESAVDAARRHEQLSRGFAMDAYIYMAASYAQLDHLEEARAAIGKALKLKPWWTLGVERAEDFRLPNKDPAITERRLADLAKAGLPELPPGFEDRGQDRMTAAEVRALIFGHTLGGYLVETGDAFTDVVAADGSISETADYGNDTLSLLYLTDDLICYDSADWGPFCGIIFRNPAGTAEQQNEFDWTIGGYVYRFSIVK